MVLGNQKQHINAAVSVIAALRYGDAAAESAFSLSLGHLEKVHTLKTRGRFFAYDVFALVGIGTNSNLLGSALTDATNTLIFNSEESGKFSGIGFGFQKDILPKTLEVFNNRRGKLVMRFANANHSIALTFFNDFRFGKLFFGEGTDYGRTGALKMGYTQITSIHTLYNVGLVLELFTPKPNYKLTPNNPINSDDGRKNVWHTSGPYKDLFYANLYGFAQYQSRYYTVVTKLGYNSEKLGAFIQNTLHDGAGLNPRFPWHVATNDKLFFEAEGALLKTIQNED